MSQVTAAICEWASSLSFWEQAALDHIIGGRLPEDSEYEKLLQYLLEDASLASKTERPQLRYLSSASPSSESSKHPVKLVRLFELENVNALVPGQTLWFGAQLTAVFGGNGSGKSGYARVLGSAGFTRGDTKVLPNVMSAFDPSKKASVRIELANGTSNVVHHVIGPRCPALASFYIFDSTSVLSHLTKSHLLSFSPGGLQFLSDLAEVTDKVRGRLQDKVAVFSQPHSFSAHFPGSSLVAAAIHALGPATDIEQLKQWATVSPEEQQRAHDLDIEIARLKSLDPAERIALLSKKKAALIEIQGKIDRAVKAIEAVSVENVSVAVASYLNAVKAAEIAGASQFSVASFSQVGSDAWLHFVKSAKALAELEGTDETPYPLVEAPCLLCQQPLSPYATDLLQRLWAFLQAEAQDRVYRAKESLDELEKKLKTVGANSIPEHSLAREALQELEPELLVKLLEFDSACHNKCNALLTWLTATTPQEVQTVRLPPVAELTTQIEKLQLAIDALKASDVTLEITRLQADLTLLLHRSVLAAHLDEVLEYVRRRKWALSASKIGGNTRHITKKHNELFNSLVTERYLALFDETLKQFDCSHAVSVDTRGRKGETFKQLVIRADPSVPTSMTSPDQILSEGEKRAIALADFLTEVMLDDGSSGVILDDPVTSLDFEWKKTIVPRLVSEAKKRQVIVFTHDLHFLYLLREYADKLQVDIAMHWIQRGTDDRPGYVFRDNSPSMERDYKSAKRAREIYAEAKKCNAEEQERLLRDGFGALRTCYEAFVVFDVFNEVVLRFDERISIGRLKQVVVDPAVAREVDESVVRLSRLIEGHLHSDVVAAKKPDPQMLMDEILRFEDLKKRQKTLRESLASASKS